MIPLLTPRYASHKPPGTTFFRGVPSHGLPKFAGDCDDPQTSSGPPGSSLSLKLLQGADQLYYLAASFLQRRLPLTLAVARGNTAMAETLIAKKGMPAGTDLDNLVVEAALKNQLPTLRLLLAHGADPNLSERAWASPLQLAASNNNIEMVSLLLENGALPDKHNGLHRPTPLEFAIENKNLEIASLLLSKGANPRVGKTLSLAIEKKHEEMAMLLLDHQVVSAWTPTQVDPAGHGLKIRKGGNSKFFSHAVSLVGKTGINRMPALIDKARAMQLLSPLDELYLTLESPADFLKQWVLLEKKLTDVDLQNLFGDVEYSGLKEFWLKFLPELLAILGPYARKAKETSVPTLVINQASAGITRLFDFIGEIDVIPGLTYNNWARIGTLGLSFSKWKFDAMQRWKGMGPMAAPSLLEKSGLFQPTPPRPSDKVFHKGFTHYNPETGLSIEMRRAYAVISQPELGTLVIRNSSHYFGRDLLANPAYYNPTRHYTEGANLLDPSVLKKERGLLNWNGFFNVLDKPMNKHPEHHEKIAALLNAFDGVMLPYTDWKCGFKDGKAPKGMEELLRTGLMTAINLGASSPFPKAKNIRLAWVNPYELPSPVATYDFANVKHQQEVTLFLDVQGKRKQIRNAEEYRQKIPELLTFLEQGLTRGLELVLVE